MYLKNNIDVRFTRSYDYLFPILGKDVKLRSLAPFKDKLELGVLNVYYKSNLLVDDIRNDTNGYLYVVIKKENYPNWEPKLLKRLRKTFPIGDTILILVFDIIDYTSDIEKFTRGQYSQFSEDLKTKILEQFPNRDSAQHSVIINVLYPNAKIRKGVADWLGCPVELINEVTSIPDVAEETLIVRK